MILAWLTLEKYRNLIDQKLTFSRQVNIILGKNGQGKSNLLEAIFLLSSTRSFRTPLTREVIHWGSPGFRLVGEVETNQRSRTLLVAAFPSQAHGGLQRFAETEKFVT